MDGKNSGNGSKPAMQQLRQNGAMARDYCFRAAVGMEKLFGMKTMVPPEPKVRKAESCEKILFVGPKNNDRGTLDFDYMNFYLTFKKIGYRMSIFECASHVDGFDAKNAGRDFLSMVESECPDMVFTTNYTELLIPMADIKKVSFEMRPVTCNFNSDDILTFAFMDRWWAQWHNFVLTTEKAALENYHARGYRNALLTQYGFNPEFFRRKDVKKDCDVSFTGSTTASAFRKSALDMLQKEGQKISIFGHEHRMMDVINRSKINLNFSGLARAPHLRHIKARVFEVAGCGGFLLTEKTPNIGDYFEIGKELDEFSDARELREKIAYYLENSGERERMADRAYRRSQKEHTYQKRMEEAMGKMFPGQKQ